MPPAFLPKLVGAFLLMMLGYGLATLIRVASIRILGLMGVDRLIGRTALQTVLERPGTTRSAREIVGLIGFWMVFLSFLKSATETLGLAALSLALTGLAYYLPKIAIALIIITLGVLAANFVRELIH